MAYVYMKVLESAPERYDRGMRLLTLGRLGRLHHEIAARLSPGDKVLDVGCGTGALAVLLAKHGCHVTAIDISPPMLGQAGYRLREVGLADQVTLRELGAVDLDVAFPDASFDAVVSTLVLSELSDDEIAYTLAECLRIVRVGGRALIADEIVPASIIGRIGGFLFRLPFAIAAFVLTQNTTHRVAKLRERVEQAGFRIVDASNYLMGTLELLEAERPE